MSIKRKLTLTMMSIGLAAVMLTVVAITAYLIYDMRGNAVKELRVTAALTGDRNSAALAFQDMDRIDQNLEIFRMNPSMQVACIYNKEGALAAGYEATGGMACPPEFRTIALEVPGMLTEAQPITQSGEMVGSVYIVSDTSEIKAFVYKIMLISVVTIVLVLIALVPLAVYFQRTISGPILELAATANSITTSRDFTLEADAAMPDETGVLARAFNAMLGEVRERDCELVAANETLEQKVTERTRELETAMHKAEIASEAKSEFLRNMSHEFRTPLHAIISFSSYGIKEFDDSARTQLKQYFEIIQKGAERLSRLVNEVLDLSKVEHGELNLMLEQGDLRELVQRSAELVRPLIAEKDITLRFDHTLEPVPVRCDHDKIVQVITNLLGNAVKFTPAGAQIFIRTQLAHSDSTGKQVMLSVIDEGIGIPEAEKEMIFESFRQSSRTNTGAGGTGLGLAICRGIVQAHRGRIWAENNPEGKGACVTFSIPVAESEEFFRSMNTTTHTAEVRNETTA